jgi:hypothetical protein
LVKAVQEHDSFRTAFLKLAPKVGKEVKNGKSLTLTGIETLEQTMLMIVAKRSSISELERSGSVGTS